MNISNIILKLENLVRQSPDAFTLMLVSKCVEKLKVGSVSVVDSTNQLPSNASTNIGEIYLVRADNYLYFNTGTSWLSLQSEIIDTIFMWGANYAGQIGDGTTTDRLGDPTAITGGITNWTQVSTGTHSLGLTADGIAYAWGGNYQGRLGDGTTTNRSSPVTVIGGITNWSQVSASQHSLGLTADGIIYAWGFNNYGQLGNGTKSGYNANPSPVAVIGGITNWAQVSAGNAHSLGVTADGIAYGWGANRYGKLGNGLSSGSAVSPVSVVGGISNWAQVSAGDSHSLGVTADGIAYAWGSNNFTGTLGNGLASGSTGSPVSVVGGITNWSQVSTVSRGQGRHSLGLTADGIAYAWGSNSYGRLGDGTTTARSSPVSVVGGITNWSQVAAGNGHSFGLTADGIIYAWGRNLYSQLADGTTTDRSSPVTVVGGITSWSQVSANNRGGGAVASVVKFIKK